MTVEINNENNFRMNIPDFEPKGITGWLIKKGLVKDQKGANQLMIVVSIICIAIAIYFAIK